MNYSILTREIVKHQSKAMESYYVLNCPRIMMKKKYRHNLSAGIKIDLLEALSELGKNV